MAEPDLLRPPWLPDELDPVEADADDMVDESEWSSVELTGDLAEIAAADVSIFESRLVAVDLLGARLDRLHLTDVVVTGAELSGAVLEGAVLTRVEVHDSRMLGLVASRAVLRDVRFVGCRLDGAQFRMATAERVHFEGCELRSADFYGATFEQARVERCDLTGAEFSQARFGGARLQGSTLDGLQGAASLRGVHIDSTQLVPMALGVFGSLDITVDDDAEDDADL